MAKIRLSGYFHLLKPDDRFTKIQIEDSENRENIIEMILGNKLSPQSTKAIENCHKGNFVSISATLLSRENKAGYLNVSLWVDSFHDFTAEYNANHKMEEGIKSGVVSSEPTEDSDLPF